MASEHDLFESPQSRHIKLWRFMSLPKLLSMLDSRSVYFARADLLGDPFEGTVTRMTRVIREISSPDFAAVMSQATIEIRNRIFVSCWHENNYESAAFWGRYCDEREGVCVQTTFQRLWDNLKEEDIHIGRVKYIDYDKDYIPDGNVFHAILHKRRSFEHEREIRAVMSRLPTNFGTPECLQSPEYEDGFHISVDPQNLIEAIYVAPRAQEWFIEVVENACQLRNLNVPVIQSELIAAQPTY